MQNPFSISFGRINEKIIQRDAEIQSVFEDFDSEATRNTVYIITGPRGCGKTVTLGRVLDVYKSRDAWVVARLSQSDNMLEQMASLLYENGLAKFKFLKVEFSFSFHGLTFSVRGENLVSSIHVYLTKLLEYYKKKGIRVLIGIDDVAKNAGVADFARAYQGFLIDHYDVRLLMSGLAKNISKLQTDRSLTFLFRAPKIKLPPLSIRSVASSYQDTFGITEEESIRLAKLTKGYAMAYQVLGDILFRTGEKSATKAVLKEFDDKLSEWSYETIWSKLSNQERKILSLVAMGRSSNQSLMEELQISKGNLAVYKKKLADEGLLNVSVRGKASLALPRFDCFVRDRRKFVDE